MRNTSSPLHPISSGLALQVVDPQADGRQKTAFALARYIEAQGNSNVGQRGLTVPPWQNDQRIGVASSTRKPSCSLFPVQRDGTRDRCAMNGPPTTIQPLSISIRSASTACPANPSADPQTCV